MIITRAPFRISFFGGGTDHPAWFKKYSGKVLSTTIDKYCYVTCRYLPPFFRHTSRIVYSKIESVREIEKIKNPVVRECLGFMRVRHGLEIHHDADLPARTGLGTSSSFTVALLHALYSLQGKLVSKKNLADDAIFVEQKRIKEAVGSQDQVAAAFGGFNRIDFTQSGQIKITPIILTKSRLKTFQHSFLLFFTGFTRLASEIEVDKVRNFSKRKREMTELSTMVDTGCNLLVDGKLNDFGLLLHEGWMRKRSLSTRVSTLKIDEIYNDAMQAGATGGKLLGAGGGGFILFFVKPEYHSSVRKKLKRLLEIPFTFENTGSQVIFYKPEYLFNFRKNARQE